MRKSHSEHFSAVPQNKRGLSEGGSQKKLIWLFSRASGRIPPVEDFGGVSDLLVALPPGR
jgi:hypothetical protein